MPTLCQDHLSFLSLVTSSKKSEEKVYQTLFKRGEGGEDRKRKRIDEVQLHLDTYYYQLECKMFKKKGKLQMVK